MLNFNPAFSLSSFTLIKGIFSSSSLSAIRVVSSAHLRFLIFPLAIWIPAYDSSSLAFHIMMYSASTLNKQDDNIQPWRTPSLILNQSVVPCLVLTVASWPAYRFLRRQVKWSGIPISIRIFHHLLWSTVKCFSRVSEGEEDIFLEFPPCFFCEWILAIWSLVPLPFLNSSFTSGNSMFTYCWSLVWRILSITLVACEMNTIEW